MLDLKFIRENSDTVKKAIKDRGMKLDIEELLSMDTKRRELLTEVEALKHKKNIMSQGNRPKINPFIALNPKYPS